MLINCTDTKYKYNQINMYMYINVIHPIKTLYIIIKQSKLKEKTKQKCMVHTNIIYRYYFFLLFFFFTTSKI